MNPSAFVPPFRSHPLPLLLVLYRRWWERLMCECCEERPATQRVEWLGNDELLCKECARLTARGVGTL